MKLSKNSELKLKAVKEPTPMIWQIVGDAGAVVSIAVAVGAVVVPGAKWVIIGGAIVKLASYFAKKYGD